MTMEQQSFEEEGFQIGTSYILEHKEGVVDFFGDNRGWYLRLLAGGSTYKRTSLDSQRDFEGEGDADLPPLEPERVIARVDDIARFFGEYKDAKRDFLEYMTRIEEKKKEE